MPNYPGDWNTTVFTLLSFVLLLQSTKVEAILSTNCFFPNGTDRNTGTPNGIANVFTVCDNTADVSMCCALERQNYTNTCLGSPATGICQESVNGVYIREACSDQTWTSPKCLKLCVDGNGKHSPGIVVCLKQKQS